MDEIEHGLHALGAGWRRIGQRPRIIGLVVLAIGSIFLTVVPLVAATRSLGGVGGVLPLIAAVATVVLVLASLVLAPAFYGAAFVAADPAADEHVHGFRGLMRAASSRVWSILGWVVITAVVHGVIRDQGPNAHLGLGTAIGIAFDALTFLLLPTLVLDPDRKGIVGRGLRLCGRGFVGSLVIVTALRAIALTGAFASVGMVVGSTRVGGLAEPVAAALLLLVFLLTPILIAWGIAARVAWYRRVAAAPATPPATLDDGAASAAI